MGMYDTFDVTCPTEGCNNQFSVQSKITHMASMDTYKVGDTLVEFSRQRVELKESCPGCNKHPIALFDENGVLSGYFTREQVSPTLREGPFASLLDPDDDRSKVTASLYNGLSNLAKAHDNK